MILFFFVVASVVIIIIIIIIIIVIVSVFRSELKRITKTLRSRGCYGNNEHLFPERGRGGARVGVAAVRRHGHKAAEDATRQGSKESPEIPPCRNRLERYEVRK